MPMKGTFRRDNGWRSRWPLIAGRLPGRTVNDVKNYWNSHISRRLSLQKEAQSQLKSMKTTITTTTQIVRPQPRTFSPNSKWLNGTASSILEAQLQKMSNNAMPGSPREEGVSWWKSLLADVEDGDTGWSKSGEVGLEEELPQSFEVEEKERMRKEGDELMMEGGLSDWDRAMNRMHMYFKVDNEKHVLRYISN